MKRRLLNLLTGLSLLLCAAVCALWVRSLRVPVSVPMHGRDKPGGRRSCRRKATWNGPCGIRSRSIKTADRGHHPGDAKRPWDLA